MRVTKRQKKTRPRLVVYIRKMVVDAEDHSYALRGIPKDKQDRVVNVLKGMEEQDGLMRIRVEEDEIVFGVREDSDGDVCNYDHGDESYYVGELTEKIQEAVGRVLRRRIRADIEIEEESVGELIWGDDWNDCPGAFTEDERSAFGN